MPRRSGPPLCRTHLHLNLTPAVNNAPFNSLEDLQYRMAKVEDLLGLAPAQQSSAIARVEKPGQTTPLPLLGTVVVKGNRSLYHGQNDRVTLLNQFLEVKDFINNMPKDEQLQASAKQVKFLQEKSQTKIASPDSVNDSDFSLALLKLREFLPPKSYCDRLVSIYFRFFERTMRVLHGPTFMRHYEQIWLNSNPEICSTSSIIPQLTVVMTMAYHMDDALPDDEGMAHRTYLKGAAIDLIQAWLDELGRKQRTELSTLQVEILLLLSRSLRHLYPEKLWSSTGALVRTAMVMGLHMDPTGVSGVSPYQAEMRRRLWATLLEMDLQASMTAGMPLIVPTLDSYNLVPANLNDTDFDESSTKLPRSRPLNNLTDSLYQVCLATSLPQRLRALSLVQRTAPDTDEAIELGRKVEECLSRKPSVLSLHHNQVAPSDEGALLHRVLLDLYLRRPILCLYKPLLLADQQDHTSFTEIQKHCLGSSLVILSYQDLYTTQALGAVTENPLPQQDFFYRCCKTDMLWAALTICQHIRLIRQAPATDQPLDREIGHEDTSLIRTVENTIEHLISRIGWKGSDLKDIVFLSLALKWVQLADSSPGRAYALRQSTRRTLAACLERLLQSLVTHSQEQPNHQHLQHQSLNGHHQHQHSAPPAKRRKGSTTSILNRTNAITPPVSNGTLTTSLSELQFPMDLPENAGQWFGDLPDLAEEFTNFQADMYNPNDAFNFGMTQDWNWDHMWQ
ncbi:hypothetical protein EJ02DRAFT_505683 [Clathrospora elynae]|uniref:Xylanolytic transcriptional activator regulatory domain-containing protein n=1 Tax=Clathrospora elynae TaxID=706981 RepID=A0A6A5SDM0_9PLEO|nr:hypothetical protein EJ02DRAFT_505683 [Clathrospora elynae]